jgi:hypothetical protein
LALIGKFLHILYGQTNPLEGVGGLGLTCIPMLNITTTFGHAMSLSWRAQTGLMIPQTKQTPFPFFGHGFPYLKEEFTLSPKTSPHSQSKKCANKDN